MEAVERGSFRRNRIYMRRSDHRMAIAAQKIGTVLIGYKKKKVWARLLRHYGVLVRRHCATILAESTAVP
jgi:hypothetical protein